MHTAENWKEKSTRWLIGRTLRLKKATSSRRCPGERAEYEIEIESLDYSGDEENKGILFKVTDERLLDLTGGIVQG